MDVVLVFHGSEDEEYIESIRRFSETLNLKYAFNSYSHPLFNEVVGDVYIPIFIGYGEDYLRTVKNVGYAVPPIIEWPGFREFLLSLGPGLYVFHGNNEPRFLNEVSGLNIGDVAFLKMEPRVGDVLRGRCFARVIPVVLTRGLIYREVERVVNELCPGTVVERPLLELESFIDYFRRSLPWVLSNVRRHGA
ncbi:hypothetical protein [Vulcanisaeta thermophila]|uniref:hypothetical protein n=1 Tax=Vulcanisaeta thermophila TaxID=867917 RepID=UPI000853730F|nr:hypothetical protein [Vulcanisaeta thermophila]